MERYFHSDVIGIIETDADYRIVRANLGAQNILGHSEEELRQRTWMDITHPDDIQRARDHFEPHIAQRVAAPVLEVRYMHRSGNPVTVALNVQPGPAGEDGRPEYYIGFVMDISRQRKAEAELLVLNRKIAHALGDALASRDAYTAGHQDHVVTIASGICEALALPAYEAQSVVSAAAVHDIGKIAVPLEFLTKPTKLTDLEMGVIRSHAQRGFEILMPMQTEFPVAEIVHQHHERLDGSGYPRALRGSDILKGAQIVACADMVDSMINPRPYRTALGRERTLKALQDERGCRLDTDSVDACIDLIKSMPT